MDSSEARVSVLEMIIKTLRKAVSDLAERVGRAEQQQQNASGNGATGASGGGVYKCNPSGSIAGATGTLGSQTCSSTTADVYQCAGGAQTLVGSGATITNYLEAATVAGKSLMVLPDGSGGFGVYSQSCT